MCVGNIDNQQAIFDKYSLTPINKLLQVELEKHEECKNPQVKQYYLCYIFEHNVVLCM